MALGRESHRCILGGGPDVGSGYAPGIVDWDGGPDVGSGYAPGIVDCDGELACGGLNAGSARWNERPRWL
jgi:hypothetical protein